MADEPEASGGSQEPTQGSEDQEEVKKKISVTIKTPKDKQVVEVEEDASIKEVSLCLTYKRVLGSPGVVWS